MGEVNRSPATALHLVARHSELQSVAELLLNNGADVNAKGDYGYTPLHLAAEEGAKGVVELLLARGADVNAKTDSGMTPLHSASISSWASTSVHDMKGVVGTLSARRANVNARDTDGDTPLHFAASHGSDDIAELLLAGGANVNARSKSGTPLDFANFNGHKDMARLLRLHGGR